MHLRHVSVFGVRVYTVYFCCYTVPCMSVYTRIKYTVPCIHGFCSCMTWCRVYTDHIHGRTRDRVDTVLARVCHGAVYVYYTAGTRDVHRLYCSAAGYCCCTMHTAWHLTCGPLVPQVVHATLCVLAQPACIAPPPNALRHAEWHAPPPDALRAVVPNARPHAKCTAPPGLCTYTYLPGNDQHTNSGCCLLGTSLWCCQLTHACTHT